MTGTELILAAVTAAGSRWAWRAWFHPFTQCRACDGTKVNPGSTRTRYGLCRKCKGSGSRQVLGSKQLHRAVRSVTARKKG